MQWFQRFNRKLGAIISWLTLAMVVVTFAVVILRYAFNVGWIALQESITYMHAMVFLLATAYAFQREEHVRVDIFYRDFSPRRKALVNIAGTILFLLPLSIFIIYSSWDYVTHAWQIMETSPDPGGIPAVFLLKSLIPLMGFLLALQGLSNLPVYFSQLCKSTEPAN